MDKSHYVLVEYNGLVQALSNTCSTMSLKVDGIIILAEKPWHEHSGSVKGNGPLYFYKEGKEEDPLRVSFSMIRNIRYHLWAFALLLSIMFVCDTSVWPFT